MTNKVIGDKSRCANCMSDKSRFLKQKAHEKLVRIILILNHFCTNHYKTCWHIVWRAKKYRGSTFESVKN